MDDRERSVIAKSSDSDDEIGPPIPENLANTPDAGDLILEHEARKEERRRASYLAEIDYKNERRRRRDDLDILLDRPETGSKEHMLQKKYEKSRANRQYAEEAKDTDIEVPEKDLMGNTDSVKALLRKRRQRDLSSREQKLLQRRIRDAEIENRIAQRRKREQETMDMFRKMIAKREGSS